MNRSNLDNMKTRDRTRAGSPVTDAPPAAQGGGGSAAGGPVEIDQLTGADDLKAIEAIGTTGLLARTAGETWAVRTITGDTEIAVTNGNGVAGNPTLEIGEGIVRTGGTLIDTTDLDALSFSNPPTQAECEALRSEVSSLLATLRVHA